MLRAGELLALVAFLSWSSSRVPSAAAAVLRLAGSLLLNARFVFVLGNAIVLLLFALSRHDLSASSSSQTSSANNEAASATTPTLLQAAPAAATAGGGFVSFATPAPAPSSTLLEEAVSLATPAAPAPPAASMAAPEVVAAAALEPAAAALVDKAAVRVSKLARAPRRSRSEKMGPRLAARRAASPELRRSESENGRRRRSSVTARDAQACWGMDDADEFRRTVEAFIAKQTRFHREEAVAVVAGGGHCGGGAPAFAGALAVVE
ncbi:unnamed protein product [Urochloa humidicola]